MLVFLSHCCCCGVLELIFFCLFWKGVSSNGIIDDNKKNNNIDLSDVENILNEIEIKKLNDRKIEKIYFSENKKKK